MNKSNISTLTQILETLNRQEVILSQIVFALSKEDVVAIKTEDEKKKQKGSLQESLRITAKTLAEKNLDEGQPKIRSYQARSARSS